MEAGLPKDIDIAVSLDELQRLKQESLIKNDRLQKYEIKYGDIDVDIYVSHFSKLALPVEELEKYMSEIEGFKVVSKEALLVLKQGAEIERGNSVKGEKDRIDIISLLFFSNFDFESYARIINRYSKAQYIERLISLLKSFKDYNSLNLTPREFKIKKDNVLKELKRL